MDRPQPSRGRRLYLEHPRSRITNTTRVAALWRALLLITVSVGIGLPINAGLVVQAGSRLFVSTSSGSSLAKKWHPGHYLLLFAGDQDSTATLTSRVTEIAGESQVKGLMIRYEWDDLEGATLGSYDFTQLHTVVDAAAAVGKYIFLLIRDRTFSGGSSTTNCPVPAYVKALGVGGCAGTSGGSIARIWRSDVMDREIALFSALCNEFEESANFHGFVNEETALSMGAVSPPADFSNSNYSTQLVRMYGEVATTCVKTLFMGSVNFNSNAAWMQGVVAGISTAQIGITGPDAAPTGSYPTTAEQVYMGLSGGHDYRGELPAGFQFQSAGIEGAETMDELYAEAHDDLQNHFMFWPRQTATSGAGFTLHWQNIVLPALRTGAYPTNTVCPSNLPHGCTP